MYGREASWLRVIAGKWKGRSLIAPEGTIARPTTDRVKESMFNLIGHHMSGGYVLDLFAGSGALGIEALSRGAGHAVFVDESVRSLHAVRENLKRCRADGDAQVWRADWKKGISRFANEFARAEWVFVDPPYGKSLWEPVVDDLARYPALFGGIVCEHPKNTALPEEIRMYSVWKHKVYGDIAVTIYTQKE